MFSYYNKKRAGAETKGDQPKDPEKGFVIDVTSNRLPYTYAGQVKSLMKEVWLAGGLEGDWNTSNLAT